LSVGLTWVGATEHQLGLAVRELEAEHRLDLTLAGEVLDDGVTAKLGDLREPKAHETIRRESGKCKAVAERGGRADGGTCGSKGRDLAVDVLGERNGVVVDNSLDARAVGVAQLEVLGRLLGGFATGKC